MVERIIELSVRYKWAVFGAVLALAVFAADAARRTPLDAVPDLSDPQVIVYTEWMGRSPDLVEDQITYPLIRALQSTPSVRRARGCSSSSGGCSSFCRRVCRQCSGPMPRGSAGSSSTCFKTRRAGSISP